MYVGRKFQHGIIQYLDVQLFVCPKPLPSREGSYQMKMLWKLFWNAITAKVCGHTASPTKISKEHYEDLFNRGLLDDRYSDLGTLKRARQRSKCKEGRCLRTPVPTDSEGQECVIARSAISGYVSSR